MTASDLRATLDRVRYKDWNFALHELPGGWYLQVHFIAPDSDTGERRVQKGRKWLLSRHMTTSEVIQTALKAVLAAEEHEAREQFLVDGLAIYGPHINAEALLEVAQREDRRPEIPARREVAG